MAATTDSSPRPQAGLMREMFEAMWLIRRFEERAAEEYMRGRIGGFLHLAIGEEAAVVGAISALRPTDPITSTYREHGQALARGSDPKASRRSSTRPRPRSSRSAARPPRRWCATARWWCAT